MPEVVSLVAAGVNIDDADYDGRTALHLAASEGHHDTVEYFIAKKADLSPLDRWGGTPLSDAIKNKHKKVIALLKKYGAK